VKGEGQFLFNAQNAGLLLIYGISVQLRGQCAKCGIMHIVRDQCTKCGSVHLCGISVLSQSAFKQSIINLINFIQQWMYIVEVFYLLQSFSRSSTVP
jgi:hypothetical protein